MSSPHRSSGIHALPHGGIVFAIVTIMLVMPASRGAAKSPETDRTLRTVVSDIPWQSAAAGQSGKVIYGSDDRLDVYEETDLERRTWAESVCALVDATALQENDDGTFTLSPGAFTVWGYPPCEEEPFASQPIAAYCSGFMVAEDLIATAGHCIWQADLPLMYFVFGFEMLDETTPRLTYNADQVYRGVAIVVRQLSQGRDFAVVRVDRPISVAAPLPLRTEGDITLGEPVGVIGHPVGLPKKIAFGENTVVRANDDVRFFAANLDSYGGNSGSPVFNAVTGLVEGILVRGNSDFIVTETCFRSNVLPDETVYPEEVSKSATFVDWVYGEPPVPVNSTPEQAIPLTTGQTITGSNLGAPGETASNCSSNDTSAVWFSFVPEEDGVYELSLCGSGFDTTLAVYTGSEEPVDCNDDWQWCGYSSRLCVSLNAAQEYLIRVAGYAESTGDYVLDVVKVDVCETFEEDEEPCCCRNGFSSNISGELLLLGTSLLTLMVLSVRKR